MNVQFSIHRIATVHVGAIRYRESFVSRDIIITDNDGAQVEIVLFGETEEDLQPTFETAEGVEA